MNKLRKPRPGGNPATNASNTMSRTMQLAVSGMKISATSQVDESSSVSVNLQRKGTWFSAPLAAAPRTYVERYWAARALVAETLLSAREQHQVELTEVRQMEEWKRERDIATILHANDKRQRRSEWLMVMCLAVLLGFIGWLVMLISPDRRPGKPLHFTIPILSPFASVVEHETGIFGTKAVVILVMVVGIATYVALKQWISPRWHTR